MLRRCLLACTIVGSACGGGGHEGGTSPTSSGSPSSTTADPTSGSTATAATMTGSGPGTTATSSSATSSSTSNTTAATGSSETAHDDTSTGTPQCERRVVLMGYWPPTNEMLRPWSTDPAQNPGGWMGDDWHGLGYDVHAFFPEFPPDGDPTNDDIGDDGAVGSPDFDLRVDYQATSADFWRIVDEHQPVIVLTTSRGGDIGWEIEAIEGGHGEGNAGDVSLDWISDGYGVDTRPTEATVDARTWDAITTHRQGMTLPSQLPMDAIFDATSVLGVGDVAIDETGTSGNFLSGFLALHGLYYQMHAAHAVAAGHIHVGFGLPVADASTLVEATLQVVLESHPADLAPCP